MMTVATLLAPPRPVTGAVIRPADIGGRVAWDLLVRDGALVVVHDEGAVAVSTRITPEVRVRVIAPAVPRRVVVTGATAAWVYCGAGTPEHPTYVYRAGTHRPRVAAPATISSARALRADTRVVAGVAITTKERTAAELALRLSRDEAIPLLVALGQAGADLRKAARQLNLRVRAVGRVRALDSLAAAIGSQSGQHTGQRTDQRPRQYPDQRPNQHAPMWPSHR